MANDLLETAAGKDKVKIKKMIGEVVACAYRAAHGTRTSEQKLEDALQKLYMEIVGEALTDTDMIVIIQ